MRTVLRTDNFFKMKYLVTIICLTLFFNVSQSQELNFKSIAETEDTYNSGNIAARMVEGLGFRYYWATEGLRDKDLRFAPAEEGRNSRETIDHLYSLTRFLLSALEKEVFDAGKANEMTFEQVRTETLENLEKSVTILKSSKDADFADYNIKFANGSQMPFWNAINGPIADAIYHTGQVVLMRRMSGNPIPEGVNVLAGVKN